MMFIIRSSGELRQAPDIHVKLSRTTPAIVPDATGKIDFFCLGSAETMATLRTAGWVIIELHDGYYEDGSGGGVAIWGQGKYWEIRDTPFTIKEAVGPTASADPAPVEGEQVNIRGVIFGA